MYAFLADVVLIVHVGFVAFVIVALLAVLVGWLLGWGWVRNLWFRISHVVAIGIVVAESWAGVTCPLTTWEDNLRRLAGQNVADGSFIGRWLQSVLFYDFEPWVFTVAYTTFGGLVLLTFLLAPPRLRRTPQTEEAPTGEQAAV